jgi:hypothetical protein
MKLKLRTTLPQFEALHAAADKARKPTSKVSIEAAALSALLADHSRLNAALRGEIQED